ncbi:hydrolase [Alteromonas pelagimontana]|uniref:Hydrolase n=2 Tax=Alteromonas pelagimontana TaxID=1858656 RepID=A0A6M4MI39_9ALTE|nr:hydrolase [Alteromonas pelagimontana]
MRHPIALLFVGFGMLLFAAGYAINNHLASSGVGDMTSSAHFKDGKFSNDEPVAENSVWKILSIMKRSIMDEKIDPIPKTAIPVKSVTSSQLENLPDEGVFTVKLGHSSILLKVNGELWLLDPVFSERASPFSFTGPKRFHAPPISLSDLPHIDRVLISHNHYDHLDKPTMKALAKKAGAYFVPLGVKSDLVKWGIDPESIHEFDWWQEKTLPAGMVAFTPSRHFSGRALTDGNTSLWGSWVLKTAYESLFFSGDSGYFSGFKQIGERFGPFDLTMIEAGAYDKDWPEIHMTPEQSVQAHLDLQGRTMIPIHNGTFNLAFHPWYEPLERVLNAADANEVVLSTPMFGEVTGPDYPANVKRWWRDVMSSTAGSDQK